VQEQGEAVGAWPDDCKGRLRLGVAALQDGDKGTGELVPCIGPLFLRFAHEVRLQRRRALWAGPDGNVAEARN
jgi:hypothetical protein